MLIVDRVARADSWDLEKFRMPEYKTVAKTLCIFLVFLRHATSPNLSFGKNTMYFLSVFDFSHSITQKLGMAHRRRGVTDTFDTEV